MVDLRLGDCLEVMDGIADASVDLILADLPYGTTALRWDQVIPFEPLWAHYKRLLKPRGAVVLTASQPFTSMLVMSNREWFKYCLVTEKSTGTGFLDAKYRPIKVHEDVVVFSLAGCSNGSDPAMTYHPQMGEGVARRIRREGNISLSSSRSQSSRMTGDYGPVRYPRSVLYFPKELATVHPTQKPVALMEYLIRTYSNEGDTVLDSCMGSGTTLVACLNTNRDGIGIEKDPAIFATARRRLADEANKTALLDR